MRRATQKRRKTVSNRRCPRDAGYSGRWDRYSLRFRRRHPLCCECLRIWNKPRPAEQVDHIIPVEGPDDPLFWTPSNHQSLCRQCHGLKSWRESMGWAVNWKARDDRQVITGKPGGGKGEFTERLADDGWQTFDMDRHGVTKVPAAILHTAQPLAIVCASLSIAHVVARITQGRLTHVWLPEPTRLGRLYQNNTARNPTFCTHENLKKARPARTKT